MRILFLSDNFPPESNAPATRLHEHALRWVRAGHEVTVVTCAPNFPEGKLYEGYRNRWRQVETGTWHPRFNAMEPVDMLVLAFADSPLETAFSWG